MRRTFAVVALFLCSCASTSPLRDIETLTILSPSPGSHVFTNKVVNVMAKLEPWDGGPLAALDATLSVASGSGTTQIAAGDLRTLMSLDKISARWDASSFAPGRYELVLTVKGAQRPLIARTNVELRDPPQIDISVTAMEPVNGGTRVRFEAEADTAPPATITSYHWDFGDGSPLVSTTGPEAEHTYAELPAAVNVLAHDSLGGAAQVTWEIEVSKTRDGGTRQAQTCGCKSLTVIYRVTPQSSRYCAEKVPENAGIIAETGPVIPPCPDGQVAYRCKLGDLDPPLKLGVGFEIEAILNPGSAPELCSEGQYVMATMMKGAEPVDNPYAWSKPPGGIIVLPPAPGRPPFVFKAVSGVADVKVPPFVQQPILELGADSYDKPDEFKKYEGQAIRWIDGPGSKTLTSMDAEFVSFVRGPTGTCWVHFRVQRSVNAAGVPGGTGLTFLNGFNARVR